jgi:membrane protein implicated in regulation of membrane protease activity
MATPRMMVVLLGASGVVVAAVAAHALLPSWWILVTALLVHAVATADVIRYAWRRAGETHDMPDR